MPMLLPCQCCACADWPPGPTQDRSHHSPPLAGTGKPLPFTYSSQGTSFLLSRMAEIGQLIQRALEEYRGTDRQKMRATMTTNSKLFGKIG